MWWREKQLRKLRSRLVGTAGSRVKGATWYGYNQCRAVLTGLTCKASARAFSVIIALQDSIKICVEMLPSNRVSDYAHKVHCTLPMRLYEAFLRGMAETRTFKEKCADERVTSHHTGMLALSVECEPDCHNH